MVAVFNFYRASVDGTQRKGTYPGDKAAQQKF